MLLEGTLITEQRGLLTKKLHLSCQALDVNFSRDKAIFAVGTLSRATLQAITRVL